MEARAPGRVNLIGEHTDYNDGFVMPAAIPYETTVRGAGAPGGTVTIESEHFGAPVRFEWAGLDDRRVGDWSDYARGVLLELARAGVAPAGADLHVTSTLPVGAGLSSSASFEIALTLAMLEIAGATMEPLEIAKLAQRAESEHTGTRSGIMDQFAVLFSRKGAATFLDTRSLEYAHVPIPAGAAIVICNTMVRRELAAGEYNERRAQCEAAVRLLQTWYPQIRALRDVSPEELEVRGPEIPPLLYHRARHVVTENRRVLDAKAALERGDLAACGALMNASHASLRDDYEVSCPELDAMVASAMRCPGVYGARMTGGGFGGCTVNLVDAAHADAFRAEVARAYHRRCGIQPEIYDGTPSDGARANG